MRIAHQHSTNETANFSSIAERIASSGHFCVFKLLFTLMAILKCVDNKFLSTTDVHPMQSSVLRKSVGNDPQGALNCNSASKR